MLSIRPLIISTAMCLLGTVAFAQMTPADLKAQVDARSGNLSGFQELLDDPDPRRSLAAVEGMLASGDSNLERMALVFGLTNPDAAIRTTALDHHFAKLPAISVNFNAADVPEEQMDNFAKIVKGLDGSMGPDKKGSFSFQPAAFDEAKGCYPHATSSRVCAMRLGTGFVDLYFNVDNDLTGRWVSFRADGTGILSGGVNFDYRGEAAGTVPLTISLLN